jgi:carboxyl-terminal processing protease
VQLEGVKSDIVFPDFFSTMKIGERYEDNRLDWTTVSPARFQTWKNPVQVSNVQQRSIERTSKNEKFALSNEQADFFREERENSVIALNLTTFQKKADELKERSSRFEDINKQRTSVRIARLATDVAAMQGDTVKIAVSERWVRELRTDIFLEEAVKIVGDMR